MRTISEADFAKMVQGKPVRAQPAEMTEQEIQQFLERLGVKQPRKRKAIPRS